MHKEPSGMQWATSIVPVFCAGIIVVQNLVPFSFVVYSVLMGFVATLFVVFFQRLLLRNELHVSAAREISPALGRFSWMALALVLLIAGVNKFTVAIFGDGIPVLDGDSHMVCIAGESFHQMDVFTLVFGGWLVLFNVVIPRTVVAESPDARKRLRGVVETFWIPLLVLFSIGSVKLVDDYNPPAVPLHPGVTDTRYACNQKLGLAQEAADNKKKAEYLKAGKEPPSTSVRIDGQMLAWSLVGLAFFFYGYFQEHYTLVELVSLWYHKRKRTTPSIQDALRRQSVRMLMLNLVVLPPMIVGVAVARADLGWADALIYGVFIYSGFAVWGLAAQLIKDSSNPFSGIGILFSQFIYAFLLTALWASVLIYIKLQLTKQTPFDTALTIALGAILIQVVFGPVFTTVWENTLSDKWLQLSSKYAILAMILSAVVAGSPQIPAKPWITAAFAAVALLVPRLLMRRNLAAYVLIRVQPGMTGAVMQQLQAEDVTATVLYGEFDLIVKIEVPGGVTGWPLPNRTPRDDGTELAELALTINAKIRPIKGIVETQTLLDFTRFVPMP